VRSETNRRPFGWVAALTAVSAIAGQLAGAAPAPAPATEVFAAPTDAQLTAALAQLKADPNLGHKKKVRSLRWLNVSDPPPPTQDTRSWLDWIRGWFAWLAETARALLWVAGILLVGLLGLYIKRFVESRGERARVVRLNVPSHVRDLDIRPESLPDDIGGAAFESWERGEHRAALALLYRGLLSRLVHVHAIPIRDSSTEGAVLDLASTQLPAERSTYVARLIRVWQRAVYGHTDPTSEQVRSLCTDFSAAVDTVPGAPLVEQPA
jgi:hypothetical protein